jgi:hypothetical protein
MSTDFTLAHTPENCEVLADAIVDSMSLKELQRHVYEDVCAVNQSDPDLFYGNCERYLNDQGVCKDCGHDVIAHKRMVNDKGEMMAVDSCACMECGCETDMNYSKNKK